MTSVRGGVDMHFVMCETDWAKHSQDHFKCNKYTDAVKNKEQKASKLKEQLKRTDFYFARYMNNKRAVEILNKKTRDDIGEKINLLVTLKNMPVLEMSFVTNAIDTTIKGKRLLKNTYIFLIIFHIISKNICIF